MAIPPAGPAPLAADASADLALPADSGADVSLSAFRVAVRCRPLLANERAQGESILTVQGNSVALTDELERGSDSPRATRPASSTPRVGSSTTPRGGASPRRERPVKAFTFDHVFGEQSTQEQLYDQFVAPYTGKFIAGYNVTVFAYGQTGTGKTHTVSGGEGDARGVVPRFIEAVMAHAAAERTRAALEEQERRAAEQGGGAGAEHEGGLRPTLVETVLERVSLSVFEVYEGKVFDLMQPERAAEEGEKGQPARMVGRQLSLEMEAHNTCHAYRTHSSHHQCLTHPLHSRCAACTHATLSRSGCRRCARARPTGATGCVARASAPSRRRRMRRRCWTRR